MKKISLIFALAYIAVASISFTLFKLDYIGIDLLTSIFVAAILNFINLFLALIAFRFTQKKSNREFLFYNLGGMTARLFLLLVCILTILKFLNIDQDGFILLFFIFYFSQLAVEIGYFSSYKRIKAE